MLVLTRYFGETLVIGDDVTVTVLDIQSNQVRLGIEAPKDVSIHRSEIYLRIQREKKLNSSSEMDEDTDDNI